MIVTLTWPEVSLACNEAVKRATSNKEKGTRQKHGMSAGFFDGLKVDILGCLGELAVSKGMNRNWSGIREMHCPDSADCIEVKSIAEAHKNLFIYMDASIRQPEFSVLAFVPSPLRVEVKGWIRTEEGKQDRFRFEHRPGHPAFLVPQKELRPIQSLIEILAERDLAKAKTAEAA